MKKQLSIYLLSAIFALLFAADASAQTVTGSIAGGKIARGKSAKATVILSIPSGLHVNSSRPGGEYAIPTRVTPRGEGGVQVGAVNYPRGVDRRFAFSERSLNVYEGRVPFTFNVSVPSSYRSSTARVTVAVRYQACTDEVCYAPKTKTITLTARVN
jgi:DsbC/DsbD-like thiol-disulfide interchange protein